MDKPITIPANLAKNVFQVHGVGAGAGGGKARGAANAVRLRQALREAR